MITQLLCLKSFCAEVCHICGAVMGNDVEPVDVGQIKTDAKKARIINKASKVMLGRILSHMHNSWASLWKSK